MAAPSFRSNAIRSPAELFKLDINELKKLRSEFEIDIKKLIDTTADTKAIARDTKFIGYIDNLLEIKDPEIEKKALDIMLHGDPVRYIIDVYNRLHVSDTNLGKTLILSVATQSATTTDGIQPKGTGSSGKGKTHAFSTVYHLIPDVGYKIEGSLSAKSLFYNPDLMPGTIEYSDDVRISDDLEDTLKRSMSKFQEKTTHRTLIKQEYIELTMPQRMVFWMTAVDSNFSDELINRLYDGNVDESSETDVAVTEQRKERAINADEAMPVDEEVKICRAIIHMVKCKLFKVIIPYAKFIDWTDSRDRRNFNRFLDLVQGFAVMSYMQRQEFEEGTITASTKDFDDAKKLYDATSNSQICKLTSAELRMAEWLSAMGQKTINEMVKQYLKADGTKYQYNGIRKTLKGNDGKSGLLSKLPGLMVKKVNGEDSFELPEFDNVCVGSIVSLKKEAYNIFS